MFRVQDRYVRATAADNQESVCGDSCVEFFFTPGSDLSKGYFNIEMNCGGTILFHFNSSVRRGIEIPKRDCDKIAKSHSMPRIVDPEIQEPVTWTVAYSIPIVLLKKILSGRYPEATYLVASELLQMRRSHFTSTLVDLVSG